MTLTYCGSLSGVDPATLQLWLTQAQTAMHELMTGRRYEVVAYAQGEGNRSVTYTRANAAQLAAYIDELRFALGMGRRRAIRVAF